MTTTTSTTTSRRSGGIIAGAVLITLGAMAFVQNVFHIDFAILPILSAIFLFAGLLLKNGLIIPGSILAGLSLGVAITGYEPNVINNDTTIGGLFFLSLAGGFVLISALSLYTRGLSSAYRWPLFPAAALAFFGAALLAGANGLILLSYTSYIFPAILIIVGLRLMLRRKEM